MKIPQNVSEAVRRLNPELYGPTVARLQDPEREPDQRRKSKDPQLDKSSRGVVYSVAIISIRKRLVDAHDNLRSGAKPLVDAITESLGFASDDNPRLKWSYGQMEGTPEGTIVKIQIL